MDQTRPAGDSFFVNKAAWHRRGSNYRRPATTIAIIMNRKHFVLSSAVEKAIQESAPVVALESTVIAHGLPRPQNLETAQRLEAIVRAGDATPATIAILN